MYTLELGAYCAATLCFSTTTTTTVPLLPRWATSQIEEEWFNNGQEGESALLSGYDDVQVKGSILSNRELRPRLALEPPKRSIPGVPSHENAVARRKAEPTSRIALGRSCAERLSQRFARHELPGARTKAESTAGPATCATRSACRRAVGSMFESQACAGAPYSVAGGLRCGTLFVNKTVARCWLWPVAGRMA